MSDDNITRLPTGYTPDTPPPTMNDVQDLQWSIALLADEIKQLSVVMTGMKRGMQIFNNKLNDIQRLVRKE